jgi:hypothetical protein
MEPGWKWRDGEVSLKEYYKLSKEQQVQYIQEIEVLPTNVRSTGDEYLIRMFGKNKIKKFIQLDDDM